MMPVISVNQLVKRFRGVEALKGVSLEAEAGEFVSIVGPTNAGKSTLLKVIGGLHRADGGAVWLRSRDVTRLPPRERGVSMLFQSMALFPTLTGLENIAFPLRVAKASDGEVRARVAEVASLLQIGHVLPRLPRTFSGGERQRTALARTIVSRPDILLLDEPLTNLDAQLRIRLRSEIKRLHKQVGGTVLYVTHDQIEAMSLSDKVIVLDKGEVQQTGSPTEIYNHPANRFVAEFIGSPGMNILRVSLDETGTGVRVEGAATSLPLSGEPLSGKRSLPRELGLGVRAEEMTVNLQRTGERSLPAKVQWVEELGSRRLLHLSIGPIYAKAAAGTADRIRKGDTVWLDLELSQHRLLDLEAGRFFGSAA